MHYDDLQVKYIVKRKEGVVIAKFETSEEHEYLSLIDFLKQNIHGGVLKCFDIYELHDYIEINQLNGVAKVNRDFDVFNIEYGKKLARKRLYTKLWNKIYAVYHQHSKNLKTLSDDYEKMVSKIDKIRNVRKDSCKRFIETVSPYTFKL